MSAFQNITFDDRDTDHFRYNQFWFLQGSWNASSVGETGTLASANDIQANLTFTFPTPAKAFYYYGIPRCCGGVYAICIDCDPNNPQFITIDAVNATDNGQNPPVVLFSMEFDTPGVHEIILKNQNDTRFGHSQITLDRFDLEVVNPNAVSEPPTDTSSSGDAFETAGATGLGASPSGTVVGGASVSHSPTITTASLVGAIVGSFVLLAFLVIAFVLYLRRRNARRVDLPYSSPPDPFQFQYAPRIPSPSGQHTTSSESMMRQSIFGTSSHPTIRTGHWPQPSTTTTSSNPFSDYRFPPPRSSSYSGPIRETDAGRLADDTQPTLPPEYEQVFNTDNSEASSSSNTPHNYSSSSSSDTPYRNRRKN